MKPATYQDALELDLTPAQIFTFFHDLEKWFRLNPQWQVLAFVSNAPPQAGSTFALEVEYDRQEKKAAYRGLITQWEPHRSLTVRLEGEETREMTIEVLDARYLSLLKYRETSQHPLTPRDKMELHLWLESVGNYLQISHRISIWSRLYKWFLDRYWLKMSPSGRRTAFFIVVAEGLSLLFFLCILLWILIFKRI
jgi:hypothetical protein